MDALRAFCSANGLKLNTNLGQHFLVDEAVLEQIMKAARVESGDRVVEIGPGVGVLTKELLAAQAKVTAIELDKRLIPLLQTYTGYHSNLMVIESNALKVPFPEEPYKIVANIPYHITSPLLRHAFLEQDGAPKSLTLLIQREVAEKICDTKKAGLLTILVHLFGKPQIITHVPPSAFLPPPKVDSSVLHIDCYPQPLADKQTIDSVFHWAKLAFSQKRKKLNNSLGKQPGGLERMEKAGISPDRRPETLGVEEWIKLAES